MEWTLNVQKIRSIRNCALAKFSHCIKPSNIQLNTNLGTIWSYLLTPISEILYPLSTSLTHSPHLGLVYNQLCVCSCKTFLTVNNNHNITVFKMFSTKLDIIEMHAPSMIWDTLSFTTVKTLRRKARSAWKYWIKPENTYYRIGVRLL